MNHYLSKFVLMRASPAAIAKQVMALTFAFCLCEFLAAASVSAGEIVPVLNSGLPAEQNAAALSSAILDAQRAGSRIVGVGDRGTILLSDDDGKTFRQAKLVPTRATLTSVDFVDSRTGWAVGHWGVVLRTEDGGETWAVQRTDVKVDRPLFSVYFRNHEEGWAVGLWSILLHTTDGGGTWQQVQLKSVPGSDKTDLNLYTVFKGRDDLLVIAAERGYVLRSEDGGGSWSYVSTGARGSLWCGITLANGTMLVAGLKGTMRRSTDDGKTWMPISSKLSSSITDMKASGDGSLIAVGLDGVELVSRDNGNSFEESQRADRQALTTLVTRQKRGPQLFTTGGPLYDTTPE